MLSSASLQQGPSRGGEDRFYSSARARSGHQQLHPRGGAAGAVAAAAPSAPKGKTVAADGHAPENRAGMEDPSSKAAAATPSSSPEAVVVSPLSNLDRFLESTTPSAPAQYPSMARLRGWRTRDADELRPYFALGDLWESFKEWSAYGAGVPLVLNESDCVIQYYVPYLSAIQLRGELNPTKFVSSRRPGEESDGDYDRDSSSTSTDGSSDCEVGRAPNHSKEWNANHLKLSKLTIQEHHITPQEGFSSDDSDVGNSQDHLLFEYLEHSPPYSREPLADKVLDLASRFPKLRTLKSCELSLSSWISVAWYPIYRIPTGPTLRDLDACFLTFHSLATPIPGGRNKLGRPAVINRDRADSTPEVSLPILGLASYKLKGSIWTPNNIEGSEGRLGSLLQAADSWLRRLQVRHPDYQFFVSSPGGTFRR